MNCLHGVQLSICQVCRLLFYVNVTSWFGLCCQLSVSFFQDSLLSSLCNIWWNGTLSLRQTGSPLSSQTHGGCWCLYLHQLHRHKFSEEHRLAHLNVCVSVHLHAVNTLLICLGIGRLLLRSQRLELPLANLAAKFNLTFWWIFIRSHSECFPWTWLQITVSFTRLDLAHKDMTELWDFSRD